MGRAPCCDKNGLKRGPWMPEEDRKLIDYIQKNGYGNWRTLPKNAGLERCGKSCRLRWTNYLRPDIKRGKFSIEEEDTIIHLHSILGNKWSAIAARLPGRTDNEIKNYWNTHIRKRLLRMGIDPVTHAPRLDLLDLSAILNPSLYSNSPSQINFSRLLGIPPAINPELLRLASSLLSTDHRNSQLPTTSAVDQAQFMQYDAGRNPAEWRQNEGSVYSGVTEDYAVMANYGCYGSDQSETTTFQSNGGSGNNNGFSFVSTPSSSPAPLNSGSGESYGSNMLDFEIPAGILDVADFI